MESVQRLAAVTRRFAFAAFLSKQTAVGRVTAHNVSLQRVIPLVGNSFKPFFRGSFQQVENRVVLRGRFTIHPFVKVFMTFWFGFLVFWIAFATVLAGAALFHGRTSFCGSTNYWWFPLAGVVMFIMGVGLVAIAKWLARNDVAWLSSVIRDALSKQPVDSSLPTRRPSDQL